jgi:CheY-like chemotaxis protein
MASFGFGSADLVRHADGHWELRGGTPADHGTAREWCSLFYNEAILTTPPVAAALPRLQTQQTQAQVHKHILVADDDVLVRGSLAAVLESEGYTVDEACDGYETVRRAIAHAPDLVLLDLNMPGWDGWTAFTQLERVRPLVPVIVITARPNQYDKAVKLGVDAFMEKPLDLPMLLCAIRSLVTEDAKGHVRRITDRGFVTKLLAGTQGGS